jgi:hypothetical protein
MFLDAWINHDENYNNRFQRPFLSRVSIACTDKRGAMHKAYQLELSAFGLENKGQCTGHFSLQTIHGRVGRFAGGPGNPSIPIRLYYWIRELNFSPPGLPAHMSRCTLLWRINYSLCTWVSIIKTCRCTTQEYVLTTNDWYKEHTSRI